MSAIEPRELPLKDGRMMLIRSAHCDDVNETLSYARAIGDETDYLSFSGKDFNSTHEQQERFIRRHVEAENQCILMGYVAGQLISMMNFTAGARPRTRHSGELGMSVAKPFWSLGVGGHLLDQLVTWAQATGIVTKLNLRVRTDNHRAIGLYFRKGFTLEGTSRRDFRIGEIYYDHHWMGRFV